MMRTGGAYHLIGNGAVVGVPLVRPEVNWVEVSTKP